MRPPVRISSDHESLGALMSVICPITSDHDDVEEYGGDSPTRAFSSGNKRRLSVEQVKALEKNFEVENKLEPERKLKLAHDLALQPRQVAVWFQNRRARWKTKNLERDYAILKASFDSLHRDFGSLRRENHSLLSQVKELKSKLENDDDEDENENDDSDASPENPMVPTAVESLCTAVKIAGDSSDDSSAVLNDDGNTAVLAANDMSSSASTGGERLVKIEEHNFLSGDETCDDFFSDEQPPSLPWYCSGADENEHQAWMFL